MDRVRAVRFGVKSIQHIETYAGMSLDEIDDDPMSTAVIGIKGAKVQFSPMEIVEKKETSWASRRPKHEFWYDACPLDGWKTLANMGSGKI
jgi:6-phosphofructokinase 1